MRHGEHSSTTPNGGPHLELLYDINISYNVRQTFDVDHPHSQKENQGKLVLILGGIVIRTHDADKNPYIPLLLRTILGPDYYVPTVNISSK